ncbi:PMT-domain-containing protein [Linderina pennispora]|uniref:Dolichyl-phosphate-mannose--protein mannosyltransferase n=1 Tax=Linderina pennispora TaxID=61395 RepID=A0A1Y1WIC7_9FUNG|nr:PMT-domain-containing protein [Linderina pennispora]ORX72966.1 PMT-domain-containing protein [Linderina pennispora]
MSNSEKRSPLPKGHSMRPDTSSAPAKQQQQQQPASHLFFTEWTFTTADALVLLLTTALAVIVRCHSLATPGQVVFDEVHFGKFAGKYINGTYFYDLHPPLAKMMFAAAGKLAGYDGMFDFKSIGLDYEAAGVPYVGMRLMPALLGVVTVPAAYVTARACGYLWDTGLLAALLVCFENGLVTQSRLILLDSPLVFFTALSLTSWSMFWTKQGRPFSLGWWAWLLTTGCMMGCAASCKWVGLFLFPAIGLSTICDLWEKIADQRISPTRWFAHFFARAVGLLAVPLAVYLFWFQVHFLVLSKTGDAAPMMTPEFQATLKGGLDVSTDRDVYYGSEIRIRHSNSRSGYLHSHHHPWKHEKGSGQQQITIYGYADPNNVWVVYPAVNRTVDETDGPRKVQSGDVIRLRHKGTGKFLHSHDKKPALTNDDNKFEVSGYGFPGFAGDANDNFRIDILNGDSKSPGSDKSVQAIYSRFRIVHTRLNCVLYNSRQKLPEWAFSQIEVNCMRNSLPRMSTWHVEYAHHPNITADVPKATYRPLTMLQKIWEYNKHMAESNESLTGDHPFAARPQHWPWLRRGTAYWGGRGKFIYQLGNPIIWWSSLAACLLFLAIRPVLFLLDKRHIHPTLGGQRSKYLSGAGFFTVAWLCHYVPFYLMGRELFIHHYFPALWMAIMVLAFTVDLVSARMPKLIRWSMYIAVLAAVLYAFQVFSFITYARTWDKETCVKSKWLKTWDFDCEHAIGGVRATDPPPKVETTADDETKQQQQEEDAVGDGEIIPPVVEEKSQDNTEEKPQEKAEAKGSGDAVADTVAGGQIGEPQFHVEPKFESVHEDEATELESIANNVEAGEKHDEL